MGEVPPLPDPGMAGRAYVSAPVVAVTRLQTENAALRTRVEAREVRPRRDSTNSSRPFGLLVEALTASMRGVARPSLVPVLST